MSLSTRTLAAALLVAATPGTAPAQRRELASGHPQARLMGYYAAVMHLSPMGLPAAGAWELGGELTYIPSLSESERRVGFGGTKQEDTNLCSVLPRLRAGRGFAGFSVEAGYVPPVRACGVTAHLLAGAVARRFTLSPLWGGALRAGAMVGVLEAAITCSERAVADALDLTCFGGNVSDDAVRPLAFELDAMLSRGDPGGRFEPYLLIGVRRERVQFDVNYTRTLASPGYPALDDHERLEASLTRMHVALGGAWSPSGAIRLGGELFYAPGALMTARARAAVALGRRR